MIVLVIFVRLYNTKNKLDDKTCDLRYSVHTINIALSLYLGSKQGYDDIRTSRLVCLPSPEKLADRTRRLKVKDGGDPNVYIPIHSL